MKFTLQEACGENQLHHMGIFDDGHCCIFGKYGLGCNHCHIAGACFSPAQHRIDAGAQQAGCGRTREAHNLAGQADTGRRGRGQ